MKIVIITKDKKGKDAQNMSFWRFFGDVLKTIYFASLCFFTQIYSVFADETHMAANGVCDAGYFCNGWEPDNVLSVNGGCLNSSGFMCNSNCIPCPAGFYCENKYLTGGDDLRNCIYKCPNGVKDIYYQDNLLISLTDSVKGSGGKEGISAKQYCYTGLNVSDINNKDSFSALKDKFVFSEGVSGTIKLKNKDADNNIWTFSEDDQSLSGALGYQTPSCSYANDKYSCTTSLIETKITVEDTMPNGHSRALYTRYAGSEKGCGEYTYYGGVYYDFSKNTPLVSCVNNKLEKYVIIVPTKQFYKFSGFYDSNSTYKQQMLDACGYITEFGDKYGSQYLSDKTWYSYWNSLYPIRFVANGGSYSNGDTYIDLYNMSGFLYADNTATTLATDCNPGCNLEVATPDSTCKIRNFEVPTRSMYIFDSFTNSDGMQVVSSNGTINDVGVQILKMANESQLWYAKWTPIHTILLDDNDNFGIIHTFYSVSGQNVENCAVLNTSNTVVDNKIKETDTQGISTVKRRYDVVVSPSTIINRGLIFDGYYSGITKVVDNTGKLQCVDPITANQKWVAQWIPIHTITLNKNGGTGESVTGAVYVKDGTNDFKTTNMVGFNSDSGVQYMSGNAIGISSNKIIAPTKNNYVFGGYKYGNDIVVDKNGIINVSSPITSSQTWVAQWVPIYEIELNYDGGNVNTNVTAGKLYVESGTKTFYTSADLSGEAVSGITVPSKDGYVFDGFLNSNGVRVVSASDTSWIINTSLISPVTSGQTWTAKWALCPAGSYCAGGTKTDCPTTNLTGEGWTVTSPAGSDSVDDCYATKTINNIGCYGTLRANKKANDGWTYVTSGVYPNTGYGSPSCSDGSCTCSANKYKITLNQNGGSGGTTNVYSQYNNNTKLFANATGDTAETIGIPTKNKNKFMGYYNQATGGLQMINANGALTNDGGAVASGILSNNTVWYAQWTEVKTIGLNMNGGTSSVGDGYSVLTALYALTGQTTLYTNEACTEPDNGVNSVKVDSRYLPARAGYKFNGYTNSNGLQVVKDDGEINTNMLSLFTSDTTWYAQWELCPADHYCTDKYSMEDNSAKVVFGCPPDGKSVPGSSKITDCYIEESADGNCTGFVKKYYENNGYTKFDYTGVRAKTGYTLDSNGACSASKYVISLSAIGATSAGTVAVCSQYNPDDQDANKKLYKYTGVACENTTIATATNKIAIPTKNGYKFAGFYTQSSGGTQMIDGDGVLTNDGYNIAKKLTADTIWYAQWNKLYTVTLYPNGEKTGLNPISFYTVGGILYTDQNGKNKLDMTWCTVNDKEGSGCVQSYDIANAMYKDNSNKNNYIFKKPTNGNKLFFDGYYNAANKSSGVQVIGEDGRLTNPYGTNDLNSERNLYWYAQWREAKIYTINLNKDGGTGGDSKYYWTELEENTIYTDNVVTSELIKDGGKYKMLSLPTKSGYLFNGYYYKPSNWSNTDNPNGNECINNAGVFVYNNNKWQCHIEGDISLNPQWTPIHKITLKPTDASRDAQGTTVLYVANGTNTFYDSNNVNNTGGEQTIAGTSIETIQIPERAGYVFGGYKYGNDTVVDKNGKISSDKVNVTSDQEWEVVWDNCPAGYYCPGGEKKECPGYYYVTQPQNYTNVSTTYNKCTANDDGKGYMCNINETDLKQTINTYLYGFELKKAKPEQSLPNNKKYWTTNNAQVTDCTLSLINGECYTYNSGYTMANANPSVVEYKYDASQKKYIRVTQKVQISPISARIKSEPGNDDLTRDYCTKCDGDNEFNVNGVCQGCDAGFYITGKNGKDPGVCQICPAGYMCPNGGAEKPILCPANSFARAGSAYCSPCAEGYTTKVGYDRGLCLNQATDGYVAYAKKQIVKNTENNENGCFDLNNGEKLNDDYKIVTINTVPKGEEEDICPYYYEYGIGCISPDACKAIKPTICLDSVCTEFWQWDLLDYITPLDVNSAVIQKR